jgi:hypothetical protein
LVEYLGEAVRLLHGRAMTAPSMTSIVACGILLATLSAKTAG